MITVATSQIDFYQKKIYRLEMQVITLQQQLMILKTTNPDEFKLKYEVLLQKITQENQSRQTQRIQELQEQEKNTILINQKWEILLSQKSMEFNSKIEALSLEKSSLRNKTIQLQLKIIKLQKQIDEGDAEILKIKLQTLKKENQRLRNQNDELYRGRQQVIDDLKKEADSRVSQAIQREKTFYRDQIQNLQKHITELEQSINIQKEKTNPERQKIILQLENQLLIKDQDHQQQLKKLTSILQQRNNQIDKLKQIIQKKDKSNYDLLNDLTNQLKILQSKDFNSKFQKQVQLKYLHSQLSKKRQAEVDSLKQQIQKINQAFDLERKQWKKIIDQNQYSGQSLKKGLQQEKQRYLDQKKRLKTKIAQLKIRLKEKQEQKGNGQTQMLIKSLREMNNAEQHFSSYQNAITFMDRQVRKAMSKIDEKNREINGLLNQLKAVQLQSQKQLSQTKQKFKNEQKKFYDRIFILEQQLDNSYQIIRVKQKEIKKIESQFQSFDEAHKIQVQNLRKIIDQMQRDYKRVTTHKKSVEDSYRQQRQNVITSKIDINTEKKNKWRQLVKQKNQMEILYRQRQIKLKNQYQITVDKLKRDRIKLIQQKQDYKAQAELLREKLNEKGQQNKQNKLIDYQKKLATLDLEIALTQNLFSTLSNYTNKKSQIAQLSEDHSSKIDSDHSFEIKVSAPVTPPFNSSEYVNQEVYKEARFSFAPRIIKN